MKATRNDKPRRLFASLAVMLLLASASALAADDATNDERGYFDGLEARSIGPWRGGRVTAVVGTTGNPYVYYMGATAGLWKTTNAGSDWVNVSDGFFRTAPVSAVDVAPSDPNVVVAGTGESPFRGVMSAQGDGVYKSTDAGRTWTNIGLADSRQIGSVKIHPTNPDVIWVAVQGGAWAPGPGRGVWKTTDGGAHWRLVLPTDNETTGAVDLKYDPSNPRVLYVTTWDMQRQPWEIRSGGTGSGLYTSTDGGETWKRISGHGLPDAFGKAGVAPSPARPGRVWVLIEADEEEAGLYRSEDYGENWTRINSDPEIRSRAWYYMHIHADPQDENTVYVLNAPFMKSVDGGKTFASIDVPHGDVHALWINPDNPKWMVSGNDGGASVSFDGGRTWSTQHNQPTGQFYRVNTDNHVPYRVYGAQQDNTTLAVASRGYDGSIGREDYEVLGGCESGYLAFDPDDPRFVYGGCFLGLIDEYDRKTNTTRSIQPYQEFGIGMQPKNARYRANWNAPLLVSRHDTRVIYFGTQKVLKSSDRGFHWMAVSPDLTRNEADKQGKMGRPYSNENIEVYNTLFSLAESPHDGAVLWAGSDDGLIHMTTDAGAHWRDVTPRGIDRAMINAIEVSPHDPATVYVALHKFKSGDSRPYLYRTTDNGGRWREITDGIAADEYARVVREDPVRAGLLYAGTERGLYVSFDRGDDWQPLQLNLPAVPVTDLQVHGNDLVLSTQGRGFWIVDDITPLRQWDAGLADDGLHLYAPAVAFRWANGDSSEAPEHTSPNPPFGAIVYYALAAQPDLDELTLKLEIVGRDGTVLRTLTSDAETGVKGGRSEKGYVLPAQRGINRAVWDLRTDAVTKVPGLYQFGAPPGGAIAGYTLPPGDYTVRLSLGDTRQEQPLSLHWDPAFEYAASTINEQQNRVRRLYDMLDELYRSVLSLQTVKDQLDARIGILEKMDGEKAAVDAARTLIEAIDEWEGTVINRKRSNGQNVLAYEPGLNFKLFTLMRTMDDAVQGVTQGQNERFDDLESDWKSAMAARDELLNTTIPEFNRGPGQAILVPPIGGRDD